MRLETEEFEIITKARVQIIGAVARGECRNQPENLRWIDLLLSLLGQIAGPARPMLLLQVSVVVGVPERARINKEERCALAALRGGHLRQQHSPRVVAQDDGPFRRQRLCQQAA